MTANILEARNLVVSYGGVNALDGVDVDVREGETLGLIGPNGAGKTTLFEVIAGFTQAGAGTVSFLGNDITKLPPENRAKLGLIRSFQDAKLFASLTVHQTLLVSFEKQGPTRLLESALGLPRVKKGEALKEEKVERLLDSMGLDRFRDRLISELSTGTRRIVELACVLALEPTLLLLDEPSSGIAQREVEALGDVLRRVKAVSGCTMVVIEHDMPLIMDLSDRIFAMEQGRPLAEGTPTEVRNNPLVIASYLGTTPEVIQRSGTVAAEPSPSARRAERRALRARRRAIPSHQETKS